MSEKNIHFNNLNGLRFLGAFMVFIFHCFTINREIWGSFTLEKPYQLLFKMATHGHHGVLLFFVLSGFLITFLLLKEIDKHGSIQLFHFLARRFLRIWPLYFFICIFGFVVFPKLPFGFQTVHSPTFYTLFLSNMDEIWIGWKDKVNFLSATWSVSIEEQFYLFWGLIIALFPFKTHQWFIVFFSFICLTSVSFRLMHYTESRVLYYHTFSVMSDVAIGGLLAVFYHSGKANTFISACKKWQIFGVYIIGCVMLLGTNFIFPGKLIVVERLVLALFFAFVILEQIESKHSFWKADSLPFFDKWGKITYGFYLFHCIYIYFFAQLFLQLNWVNSGWFFALFIPLVFCATLFTALLSFQYFEQPILRLKRYFRP